MIKRYVLHVIPEFVLCLVAAVALAVNILQSFKLTDQMYTSYGMFAAVAAIVLAALFFVGYSRRTSMIGIPVLIVVALALVLICYRTGYSLIETDVPADNLGVCYLVVIIIAFLAYVAARSRVGSGIFAVAGVIAHAWCCLCLYTFSVWALVLFICAAVVLYLYTRYRHQILNVNSPHHAFPSLMGTSVLVTVLVLALSAGIFFGIIQPLNPPTKDVKLVTKVVSLEILEKVGISKKTQLRDKDQLTSRLNENLSKSNQLNNLQNGTVEGEQDTAPESEEQATEEEIADPEENIATDDIKMFSLYDHPVLLILLICIAAFLVAAAIARFLRRHRIWLARLQQKDRVEQVHQMYYLFRRKMKLMNISGAKFDTPAQYALRVQNQTKLFDEGGPSWVELSEIFSRSLYGKVPVTEEEYNKYLAFYQKFWKNSRKVCGFRYLWKQFRL